MALNKKAVAEKKFTKEGGQASLHLTPIEELRRSVMSCLLFESGFYEDGEEIFERIKKLALKVTPSELKAVLIAAKTESKLREVPLYLLTLMAQTHTLEPQLVDLVINRADMLCELLALYWKDGKCPLSKQLIRGLDLAIRKFDAYGFKKYDRDNAIKLRDVFRLVRPKPQNESQSALWKQVVARTLPTIDTWETLISAAGKDVDAKAAAFTKLIEEKKLGDLAFVRNLRKMDEVGVSHKVIENSFKDREWKYLLPFQFITAARYNPVFESELEAAMMHCLETAEHIDKSVRLLVDVSGSMNAPLSVRSETTRVDAANGVAILLREICDDIRIYSFSNSAVEIPVRHGFALRDAIQNSQPHNSTFMWKAIENTNYRHSDITIVITDEQVQDDPIKVNSDLLAVINVGTYQNGVGYGPNSVHISGWSDSCVSYLKKYTDTFAFKK